MALHKNAKRNLRSNETQEENMTGTSGQNEMPQWLRSFLENQEQRRREEDELRREEMQMLRNLIEGRTQEVNSSEKSHANVPRPAVLEADISFSNFITWRRSWDDY